MKFDWRAMDRKNRPVGPYHVFVPSVAYDEVKKMECAGLKVHKQDQLPKPKGDWRDIAPRGTN